MNSVTFFFDASANKINKIFSQDYKIFNAVGIEPKKCGFDFSVNRRWITYQSKKPQVVASFLAKAKKSGVKNLFWKMEKDYVV